MKKDNYVALDDTPLKFVVLLAYNQLSHATNKNYLPVLLQKVPSINPYKLSNWNHGKIGAGIKLGLSSISMSGFSNAIPEKPTITGNVVDLTLDFSKSNVGQKNVQMNGDFTVDISTQKFIGTINITIVSSNATVNTTVSTQSGGSSFLATVNSVVFALPYPSNLPKCMKVTLSFAGSPGSSWQKLINNQINKQGTLNRILNKINKDLASPSNLKTIGNIVTKQLNQALPMVLVKDGVECYTSFEIDAHPALRMIIALIYTNLINPNSGYYLPDLILKQKAPSYDPFHLGNLGVKMASSDPIVCLQGKTKPPPNPPITQGLPKVKLQNLTFVGFSNILPRTYPKILKATKSTALLDLKVIFSSIHSPKYSPKITISGDYDYAQGCCLTDANGKCIKKYPSYGNGTFSLDILTSSSVINAEISVDIGANSVTVNVQSIVFEAPFHSAGGKLNVVVTNVTEAHSKNYISNAFKEDLQYQKTIDQIVKNLNKSVNSKSSLKKISKRFTTIINQQLGAEQLKLIIDKL